MTSIKSKSPEPPEFMREKTTPKQWEQINVTLAVFDSWKLDDSFPEKDRTYSRGKGTELSSTFKYSRDWNYFMSAYRKFNREIVADPMWSSAPYAIKLAYGLLLIHVSKGIQD